MSSKIVKLSGRVACDQDFVRDCVPDLVKNRWLVMGVFRCLPGSGGTQTERGRAALGPARRWLAHRSRTCQATKASSRQTQVMVRSDIESYHQRGHRPGCGSACGCRRELDRVLGQDAGNQTGDQCRAHQLKINTEVSENTSVLLLGKFLPITSTWSGSLHFGLPTTKALGPVLPLLERVHLSLRNYEESHSTRTT